MFYGDLLNDQGCKMSSEYQRDFMNRTDFFVTCKSQLFKKLGSEYRLNQYIMALFRGTKVATWWCFCLKPQPSVFWVCLTKHSKILLAQEIIKEVCVVLLFLVPPVTIGRDESRSRLSLSKAQEMRRMLVQPRDSNPTNPTAWRSLLYVPHLPLQQKQKVHTHNHWVPKLPLD